VDKTVYYTWRKENITRSKPLSVFNPKSFLQKLQRKKFSLLRQFYFATSPILDLGFRFSSVKKSPLNSFIKKNLKNDVYQDNLIGLSLIYSNIFIASGRLFSTPILSIMWSPVFNHFSVSFSNKSTGNQRPSDKSSILIYNESSLYFEFLLNRQARFKGRVEIKLPSSPNNGDVIHVWVFFKSKNNTMISDSAYKKFIIP
jgi:hypothetical protein